jgi:hypothetical protein
MILKKGTKRKEVKLIQEYLNSSGFIVAVSGPGSPGKETEIFEDLTEAAVKKWQKNNGLKDDGIVGRNTWNAMGLSTTDLVEQSGKYILGELNIKKQFLPDGEFLKGPTTKSWLFLHHTAGWENPYNTINSWARDNRGAIATEFVLGGQRITDGNSSLDGELVQAFPKGGYGWHLGTGNNIMHRNSVGVEVCNFGYLTEGGYWKWNPTTKKNEWIKLKSNRVYTYVGTEVDPSSNQVVTLKNPFRGHKIWHRYSDMQISVLKDFILFIANRDNIDVRKGLPELIRKNGVSAFDFFDVAFVTKNPGLWNHTNVRKDKFDMFPQKELIDMLISI